jgi:hypothetical protein
MLKQEDALITGAATLAVVVAIYTASLPTVAGARASQPGNPHLETSRKSATWMAAGVVGAISLLSKSPTVFLIGGAGLIALDFLHRHANATDNTTGQVPVTGTDQTAAPVSLS